MLVPVTTSLLSTLRACAPDGAGALLVLGTDPAVTLHLRIGESGAWSLGIAADGAYTVSAETLRELQGSGANVDGTYTTSGGVVRQLSPVSGAALPDDPPPNPPK